MPIIPSAYSDLIVKPAVAVIGTLGRSGALELSPVWAEYTGSFFKFASESEAAKIANLSAYPVSSLCFVDPLNPYRYLEIRAQVESFSEAGGRAFLDRMAQHFWGVTEYPHASGSPHYTLVLLRPTRAITFNFDPPYRVGE